MGRSKAAALLTGLAGGYMLGEKLNKGSSEIKAEQAQAPVETHTPEPVEQAPMKSEARTASVGEMLDSDEELRKPRSVYADGGLVGGKGHGDFCYGKKRN